MLLAQFQKKFDHLRIVHFDIRSDKKLRENFARFLKKFEHRKIFHVEFAAKSWHNTYLLRENFVTTLSIRNIKVEDYYEDYYTNLDWKLCPIASELIKEPKINLSIWHKTYLLRENFVTTPYSRKFRDHSLYSKYKGGGRDDEAGGQLHAAPRHRPRLRDNLGN